MMHNNWLALVITFALALGWLRLMDLIAQRGWISSRMSRKIIHIGTGPLFVCCWLLFDSAPTARWLAALVPLAITVQFAMVGLGIMKDEAAVQAMSRSGDRREILRGPLFYGVIFVLLTLLFWKDSPVGIVALMIMCGGDGIADLVGQRFASPHLPWSLKKTVLGSLSVFLGGVIMAGIVLGLYVAISALPGPFSAYLFPLLLVGLVATAVESLPLREVDNLTVPLAIVLVGLGVF